MALPPVRVGAGSSWIRREKNDKDDGSPMHSNATSIDSEGTMEGEKVQVIIAGGAAGAHSKKHKTKKKTKKKESKAGNADDAFINLQNAGSAPSSPDVDHFALELEQSEQENEGHVNKELSPLKGTTRSEAMCDATVEPVKIETLIQEPPPTQKTTEIVWLFFCFIGIMSSFVIYGVLMEYTTSGGRKLHELSFLFVTSSLYTVTAAAGRYVRAETPTTIPPARFAILGLMSMGSTFTSVRSLRYVIYPIQVLAKSCKPVPVMLMGAVMGKKYDLRKYINVAMIVLGVALFMGGGSSKKKAGDSDEEKSASSQLIGLVLLFISLCFDGATGAYEDKLMSVHSVQPFDLMYNIQLGKTILAGVSLLVLNQVHVFVQMCADMGFLLVALGLSGALGQVFIFVTIAKFGALTCSIIGLARKITTLVFSIWYFGHYLSGAQTLGLLISVGSMVMDFMGKGKKKGHGGHGDHSEPSPPPRDHLPEDMQKMLSDYHDDTESADVELAVTRK